MSSPPLPRRTPGRALTTAHIHPGTHDPAPPIEESVTLACGHWTLAGAFSRPAPDPLGRGDQAQAAREYYCPEHAWQRPA